MFLDEPQDELSKRWRNEFRISTLDDLDFVIGLNAGMPIAMKGVYPAPLKRAVLAGLLSYNMQLKSIDYTLRRYVEEDEYEEQDVSLGNLIHCFLEKSIDASHHEYLTFTERTVVRLGDQIADVNLMRIYSSLKAAHLLANRGLLFETMCLTRFMLEQLAWCQKCETLDNEDDILLLQATECLSGFKSTYPTCGRVYGNLSNIAHWNPEHHHMFVSAVNGRWSSTLASCRYRAIGLLYTLLSFDMFHALVEKIYPGKTMRFHVFARSGEFISDRSTREFAYRVAEMFPTEQELVKVCEFFPNK